MNKKIVNVFELKTEEAEKRSYIYSIKDQDDYLGFDYYILTKNENNEPTIIETEDPLNLLNNNNVNLVPISQDNPKYQEFILELSIAQQNQEKKKVH